MKTFALLLLLCVAGTVALLLRAPVPAAPAPFDGIGTGAADPDAVAPASAAATGEADAPRAGAPAREQVETGEPGADRRDGIGLRGVVTDSAGQPLADARVRVGPAGAGAARWLETRSADDGGFRLAGAPAAFGDAPLRLLAEADGFAPTVRLGVRVQAAGITDLGAVVLLRPATIAGWVRTALGAPLPGAQVAVTQPARAGPDLPLVAPVRTDAAGAFRLEGVPPGEVRVEATAADYVAAAVDRTVRESEAATDLALQLERGAPIGGTVVDESGAGIAGATVEFESQAGSWYKAVAREDGAFRVGPVPLASEGRLWARCDATTAEPVPAAAGARNVRIVLRARYGISGRVLDARTGEPVAGAAVQLLQGHGSRSSGPRPGAEVRRVGAARISDAQGRFLLAAPHRGFYAVAASKAGSAPAVSEWRGLFPPESQGAADLELRLGPGRLLQGRVRSTTGAPLPAARLLLRDATGATPDLTASPGADGGFAFAHVRPGRYELAGELPGFARVEVALEVPQAVDPAAVDLALPPESTVRGRVLVGGRPAGPGWVVGIAGRWSGRTDRDGRFSIAPVAPGTHPVTVRASLPQEQSVLADDGASAPQAGRGGADAPPPVLVTVPEGGIVEIDLDATACQPAHVHGAVACAGRPVADVEVVLVDAAAGKLASARTATDGRYEIWTACSGAVALELRPGSRGPAQRREHLDLQPGADVERSFELGAASVSGRVVDPSFAAIGGASVRLLALAEAGAAGGKRAASTATRADGTFAFRFLDPGSYVLVAGAGGRATKLLPCTLADGQVLDVGDLALPLPVEVLVGVRLKNGAQLAPLAEGRVVVEDGDGRGVPPPWQGGTFAKNVLKVRQGLLPISHLGPGVWRLRLVEPVQAELSLEVQAPGPQRVQWDVDPGAPARR